MVDGCAARRNLEVLVSENAVAKWLLLVCGGMWEVGGVVVGRSAE
jgi:hypothetical protein